MKTGTEKEKIKYPFMIVIRLIPLLSFIVLFSCGPQKNHPNRLQSEQVETVLSDPGDQRITFYKVNSKGVLLGENIQLLDEHFKAIKDISYLNEQIVAITAVSNKYHKTHPTDDYCEEFKYVKIKLKDIEGYVDGRRIYEPVKHIRNNRLEIDGHEVSISASTYFGIGVADDDGLTGCSIHTPVVFSDPSLNYEGLVKMVRNNLYEENYPYFELKADDGASDEIVSIERQADRYVLKIKRTYQEGGAILRVEIYRDKNGVFVAEITENTRTED